MIDKLIEKIGAKAFGALSSLVTALVAYLLHMIDKYFTKKRIGKFRYYSPYCWVCWKDVLRAIRTVKK